MAKATDTQIKETKAALADGSKPLPEGIRINFGDPVPIQKADGASDDNNGDAGLPSLSGKTKPQLEQIAADEGVDISGAATNADITSAIEKARAGE